MTNTLPATALQYLDQLDRATENLPASVRTDIIAEIRQELQAVPPEDIEAHISTLGDPYMISESARLELESADGAPGPRRESATRTTVVALIVFAGGVVIPIVGWVVGVVLLWRSNTWTLRDKIIGSVLPPTGGFASVVILNLPIYGVSDDSPLGMNLAADAPVLLAFLIVIAVLPVLTFFYLLIRAHRLREMNVIAVD